jgi:uncharacterized protein YxeA
MDGMDYIRTRKTAIILMIILLIIGSVIYFTTGIAERNNKMMYEKLYEEDANGNIDISDTKKGTEYNLVQEQQGKKALL